MRIIWVKGIIVIVIMVLIAISAYAFVYYKEKGPINCGSLWLVSDFPLRGYAITLNGTDIPEKCRPLENIRFYCKGKELRADLVNETFYIMADQVQNGSRIEAIFFRDIEG